MFLLSLSSNPLRKVLLFTLKAYGIIRRISQVGESVSHTHYKQDGGIVSYPLPRVRPRSAAAAAFCAVTSA